MTTADAAITPQFDPPGPGSWEIDDVHHPRPVTRYWAEVHPAAFRRGFSEFTSYYGMLLDTLECQYVNGFAYHAARPVADAEVPQRFQRAEETFERKLWREQLRQWDETFKPTAVKLHRELQSIEPDALSDEELAAYLERCRDHHAEMIYQHMRFTGAALLPTGDFLAHVGDWTGLDPAELLGLMRGAAPVSAGASAELHQLVATLGQDGEARALLESDGDPGAILAQLRARDDETGRAVAAYLDLVGYRLLDGFDICGPTAIELPDALLRAIRTVIGAHPPGSTDDSDVEGKIAAVREKVPEAQREEFDGLLEEARLMYRLRDERGVFSDIWASGIMRRAVLSAGRRLAAAGRIHEPEHLVDADLEEIRALLAGAAAPPAEELAQRFADRTSRSAKDAPRHLGPPAPEPPDPSGLPPAVGRLMRAIGIAINALFAGSEAEHEGDLIRGLAASRGVYEGPARCISGPDDFNRIVQGDVLVTQATTEAFNILLPLLGAIVTDSGGLLSHSAIVAREYGIPGVVGTREATDRIADGATVRVDGDAGAVTVLG